MDTHSTKDQNGHMTSHRMPGGNVKGATSSTVRNKSEGQGWGVAKHLANTHKALGSIPSTGGGSTDFHAN